MASNRKKGHSQLLNSIRISLLQTLKLYNLGNTLRINLKTNLNLTTQQNVFIVSNRASLIPLILARPRDRRDPPGLPYRLSPMGCLLWLVPYGINSTFRNFPCVGPIENRGLPIGAAHRGQPIYQWATRRSAAALLLAGLVTPVKHGFYQFCDQRS